MALLRGDYVVHSDNDAKLIWNSEAAYVFIGTSRLGWQRSYLGYARDVLFGYIRVATPPDERRASVTVLKVTPSGVQQSTIENSLIGAYIVFEGHIYSERLKWSGARFEPASPDEERRLAAAMTTMKGGDFSDVNGWSSRCCLIGQSFGETEFTITLAGQPLALVATNKLDAGRWKAIDLRRRNQPPERIWYLDERPRRVSRSQYDAFMAGRDQGHRE